MWGGLLRPLSFYYGFDSGVDCFFLFFFFCILILSYFRLYFYSYVMLDHSLRFMFQLSVCWGK